MGDDLQIVVKFEGKNLFSMTQAILNTTGELSTENLRKAQQQINEKLTHIIEKETISNGAKHGFNANEGDTSKSAKRLRKL